MQAKTGKRARRTITFDETVTSERAAKAAIQPYLDDYNSRAKANLKLSAPRSGKTVRALIEERADKILPNRKPGGARAALSHIRVYILPQLGEIPLREMNLSQHQSFVTAVGRRVDRRKTAENVYGSLGSILNLGQQRCSCPYVGVARETPARLARQTLRGELGRLPLHELQGQALPV
jgi:hypothetical protein